MGRAVGIGAVVALVWTLGEERAMAFGDTDFATIGGSLAVELCCREGRGVGFGPAINYAHYLKSTSIGNYSPAIGGYAWAHYYPAHESARVGVGGQASYLVIGSEVGPSLYFGKEPTSGALSMTPFASAGVVWVGLRFNFGASSESALMEFIAGGGYPLGLSKAATNFGH
jgi:hypothetical protein